MKQITLISTIVLFVQLLTAQNFVPTISERAKTSDLVFEGKVISKHSFWNERRTAIFTSNILEVSKWFKGERPGTVEIISMGGDVGDVIQTVTHEVEFERGMEGLFFCRSYSSERVRNSNFMALNGSTGFVAYQRSKAAVTASDGIGIYSDIKEELYRPIMETLGIKAEEVTSTSRSSGVSIEFAFDNLQSTDLASIEFDVYAKSSVDYVKFAGGQALVQYSAELFGNSVVANSNIEIAKGNVVQSSSYTVSTSDHDEETFQINVDIDCRYPIQMYELTTSFSKMFHVKMDIFDFTAIGKLSMDAFGMAGNVYYYDPERGCVPFDDVIVPDPLDDLQVPAVFSFSPNPITAGTGAILTIKGMNFGSTKGEVKFKNADDGGATMMRAHDVDVVWTMDSITVRMPSAETTSSKPAGSGFFQVTTSTGVTTPSNDSLEVIFAVFNSRSGSGTPSKIHLGENGAGDGNKDGILEFRLDSLLHFNPDAQTCARTSMCDWTMQTGIQWDLGNVSPTKTGADNDDINLIYLAENSEFFGSQSNATAYTQLTASRIEDCFAPNNETVRFHREYDIVVRKNTGSLNPPANGGWHYSTTTNPAGNQMDFYSVLSHELGHVHGLKHAIPNSKIMWWALAQGVTRRVISNADAMGGNHVIDTSLAKFAIIFSSNCGVAIQRGANCLTPASEQVEMNYAKVYPNPFNGEINIEINSPQTRNISTRVFNLIGQEVLFQTQTQNGGTLALRLSPSQPKGVYFLQISIDGKSQVYKMIKN